MNLRFRQCVESVGSLISRRANARDLTGFRFQRLTDITYFAQSETTLGRRRLKDLFPGGRFSLDRWPDIAAIHKHEIMQERGDCMPKIMPAEAGRLIDGWTAGTTGQPLHFSTTELSVTIDQLLNQRLFEDWSLDPLSTFIQIGIARGREKESSHGIGWHLAGRSGKWLKIAVSEDPDRQLDQLLALKPAVLKLYPLSLSVLIERALHRDFKLPLKLVISGGNILTPDMREGCRQVFGCEVADTYGAEEVGCIALQCPHCGSMHVSEETMLLEVIKDNGEEASPGETGRVIITPFFNFAMPLIRYDLEDYVEVGDNSAPCARQRLTLTKIRGRSTTAFRLSDGRINWPFVPARDIFALGNVKHFQFEQTSPTTVLFRYVRQRGGEDVPTHLVQVIVDRYIDKSLQVSVQSVTHIQRDADMKYMLFKGLPNQPN